MSMEEELRDGKLIVYRVGQVDDERGPEQTEYCVFNKNLIKKLESGESMSNKLFEYYEENNELSFLDACKNRNINFEIQDDKLIFDNYKDVIKCIQLLADMRISFKQNKKEITLKDKTHLQEKIVKKGNKWQVQSEKGRNMGTYDTKEEAEKRLKQVHYFKHINEGDGDEPWNISQKGYYHYYDGSKESALEKISNYVGYSVSEEDIDYLEEIANNEDDDELLGYIYYYRKACESLKESKQDRYFKHMNEDKEDYQKKFDERTHAHIDRVNKYAKKINKEYPHHDEDKFNELYAGYSLMSKENVTEEEQKLIDDATYKHVLNNEHHCEHWCNPEDIKGFSRKNPTPHGCLDCSKMPEFALEEMCCDWCAMSEEFNNTPFEWYTKNKNTRWHFNDKQDKFILDTLHKLWDDNSKEKFLNESKQDKEKFRQWAGDELASRFFAVKNRLKSPYNDLYYWIKYEKDLFNEMIKYDTWKDNQEKAREFAHKFAAEKLENAIEVLEDTPTRKELDKQAKEGAEKIYEDDRWLVVKINTYGAAVKYGKNTQWCITGTNSQADGGIYDWKFHHESCENDFYFFIDKKKNKKYALEYYDNNNWALYNEEDYVEVGYGSPFNSAMDALGDPWRPDHENSYPAFPKVKGLPDLQQAYRDAIADWSEDDLDVNDYIAEKLIDDELDEVNESVKMKKDMKKVKSQVKEAYVPTEKDFPYTLKDIEDLYPELISSEYQSYGNAFIMPDGRFILSGKRFDTHADFAIQCALELTNKEYDDLVKKWSQDDSKFLEAFTTYFNLVRVNDGSKKDVEPRAYFVINSRTISAGQEESLLDYLDFVMKNKNSLKQKDLIAFVRHDVKLWILGFSNITDDIMSDVKFAMKRGFFESLDLKEDINKYYRIELEDQFGDRSGIFVGAFELIPTKETIEDYPEDFDWLTDEERARYYKIDELISKLGALHKSPGVDTKFDKFRQGDIFAFTSETYKKVKDIVKELKSLVAQLGLKIIVNEVDIDDEDISFHDEDQVAFSYSDKKHKFKEIEESSKYDSSENVSLKEAKGKDTFIFNDKKVWSGAVNTLDGTIEEVHSYEEAQDYGFHHSFYFSDEQLDKMEKGETCFFCVFNDGKIMINAMSRFNPEDVGIKLDEKFLEKRIREQIKLITNEDMQLTELMRGKENISDEKILKYIEECIADMKTLSFAPYDYLYITYDDIDVEEGDTVRTFGTMYLPQSTNGNFKLVLNKHMFEESEEAIKNTIYHELCHYVVYKMAIENDIFYRKNGHWLIRNNRYDASDYKGHGRKWKQVAQKVSNAFNTEIKRTNNYAFHTGVAAHAEDKYKYIVKCKHCGNTFKYFKKTDFIKSILDDKGHTEDWWCKCKDGTKCHDFEIIKGK